jgi:hypothetical protein
MHIGFARMMYPFCRSITFLGGKLIKVKCFFLRLLVIIALAMPRVGGSERLWLNGLYDSAVVIFFPFSYFLGQARD